MTLDNKPNEQGGKPRGMRKRFMERIRHVFQSPTDRNMSTVQETNRNDYGPQPVVEDTSHGEVEVMKDMTPQDADSPNQVQHSFLNIRGVRSANQVLLSPSERRRIARERVLVAFTTTGSTEHKVLCMAAVDGAPENRYARVVFDNLIKHVKNGPDDLLTQLTQDILIDPHVEIEQKTTRHLCFADVLLENTWPFQCVTHHIGVEESDLQELEHRLKRLDKELSMGDPFISARDVAPERIPVLDCAVGVFGRAGSDDEFVVYHRLKLTVVINHVLKANVNDTLDIRRERDVSLLAVWERRPFHLRTKFLKEIESDMGREGAELKRGHEGEV